MPFYDYECTSCSLEFAAFQRLSDVPYLNCPDCGGPLRPLFEVKNDSADDSRRREPDWNPDLTDVHKGWKERRKWKHGSVASMVSDEEK